MKFGLWIAIGVIAFLWYAHSRKQRARERARAAAAPDRAASRAIAAERIVACAHCGLHVPASDAVLSENGVTFCSVAHRGQPPRA